MTVGIAAISHPVGGIATVHLACDRMISVSGSFEYDAPRTKLYRLGTHAAMLIAGDTPTLTSVAQSAFLEIQASGVTDIKTMADVVGRNIADLTRNMAEREHLHPLGLSLSSLKHSTQIHPDVLMKLINDMQRYARVEVGVEALVAGVESDNDWPHIYRVDWNGVARCDDHIAFSSIGIGDTHAETQFMLRKYGAHYGWVDSLIMVHAAKRAAENAPGVGTDTDMYIIDSAQGLIEVPQAVGDILNARYKTRTDRESELWNEQIPDVETELKKYLEKDQEQRKETTNPTPDQETISG
ncbi:MAG: hypothetical protein O3B95_09125 [Chloroflexi bacterium]|nr:hypothetical protein [Chloroflexota bacterium]